jgi:hypothetical protein
MVLLASILLCLAGIEGMAYWWMNPRRVGQAEAVLVYQRAPHVPSVAQDRATVSEHEAQLKVWKFTPLPNIYAKAAPILRCSGGQVFHISPGDRIGIHFAFFEWDDTNTGSVLEAFGHLPEACMGSIGMILVSKEKPILYQVGGEKLLFDHTIFREPGLAGASSLIHAYRAVWVAGFQESDARQGDLSWKTRDLRVIRLNAALNRLKPSHARVIQGAVRGATSPQEAWEVFSSHLLCDLHVKPVEL